MLIRRAICPKIPQDVPDRIVQPVDSRRRSVASMLLLTVAMINEWWAETDNAILQCLRERGAMSPAELARSIGITSGESTALLCMLAAEGKIKVRLVALDEEEPCFPAAAPPRRERSRRVARESAPVGAGKR
jgi:hypothetical protein